MSRRTRKYHNLRSKVLINDVTGKEGPVMATYIYIRMQTQGDRSRPETSAPLAVELDIKDCHGVETRNDRQGKRHTEGGLEKMQC